MDGDFTGADAQATGAVAIGPDSIAPNQNETTIGNLEGHEIDLNVTGNATIHGVDGLNLTQGGVTIPNGEALQVEDGGARYDLLVTDGSSDRDITLGESEGPGTGDLTYYNGGDKVFTVFGDVIKSEEPEFHVATQGGGSDALAFRDLNAGTAEDDEMLELVEGGTATFQNTASAGADVLRINPDGNSDVEVPNGVLNMSKNNVTFVGGLLDSTGTWCGADEFLNGRGVCTADSTGTSSTENLANTLAAGNFTNGEGIVMNGTGADINLSWNDVREIDNATFAEGIAIGGNQVDAISASTTSVAIGEDAQANGGNSVVIGKGAAANANTDMVAVGRAATVSGQAGIALGHATSAAADAIALGHNADASSGGVAIGHNAVSPSGTQAVFGAMGPDRLDVNVTGNLTVHGGSKGLISMPNGVSIGDQDIRVNNATDVAIGDNALTLGHTQGEVAVGFGANASGNVATAVGWVAEAYDAAVAFGRGADAVGDNSVAIGAYTDANGFAANVFGRGATVTDDYAMALGHSSSVTARNGVAVGLFANASADDAIALGTGSWAQAQGSVAIGDRANASNPWEATFGNLESQELDVNVTGNLTVHGGSKSMISMPNGVLIGGGNAANNESLAIGKEAWANGSYDSGDNTWRNETAVGTAARATGAQGAAFGYSTLATGEDSTAIGTNSEASALETVALGTEVQANAQEASAIGAYADANLIGTTVLGYDADASTDRDAISIGSRSEAHGIGAVALGGDADQDNLAASATAEGAVAVGADAIAPNQYEATFGNLQGEALDVNVTGDLTIHGTCTGCGGGSGSTENLANTLAAGNFSNGEDIVMNGTGARLDMAGNNITNSQGGNVSVGDDLRVYGKLWTTGADLAEVYSSSDDLAPGELVRISGTADNAVERTGQRYGDGFGVVSTDPGYVMASGENGYKIALEGKVPVRVTDANGDIRRGDRIVPSGEAGVGMRCAIQRLDTADSFEAYRDRAEGNRQCRDSTIGRALENASEPGTILVAVE